MTISEVQPRDSASWEHLRQLLWPAAPGAHAADVAAYLRGDRRDPAEVFIAHDEKGAAVGFIELSIRAYAEGCSSDRVAYIEGWFVSPDVRRQGLGAALVARAEEWARARGCSELGSDCELDNVESAAAHRSLGFEETARTICFRKELV